MRLIGVYKGVCVMDAKQTDVNVASVNSRTQTNKNRNIYQTGREKGMIVLWAAVLLCFSDDNLAYNITCNMP